MSIKTETRFVAEKIVIVDVYGVINLGGGSTSLREIIRKLANDGYKRVILNLAETSYIDSSGIGELVSGFTTLSNCGAELVLLSLTKRTRDLLQITKLYTCFSVFEDEQSAIRYFK